MRIASTLLLALLSLGALAGHGRPAGARPAPAPDGRVIVLGFDGADARTVERLMAAGELPNLKRLADAGTFAGLRSTFPAESAAGWAALNTGLNPAKNGVPSFFKKDLEILGGVPVAFPAHTSTERVARIAELEHAEPSGLLGVLTRYDAGTLAAGFGGLVFLAFFVLFALLLRVKAALAGVLALVLGGVGAWGAMRAKDYAPEYALDVHHNLIEEDGFWAVASEHGVRSVVIDAALAFDRPTAENARVLAGLGLPDVRGEYGDWFLYTTDPLRIKQYPGAEESKPTGTGSIYKMVERSGRMESKLGGPLDFWSFGKLRRELEEIRARVDGDPDLGWQESNELRLRIDELAALVDDSRPGKPAGEYLSGSTKDQHRVDVDLVVERLEDPSQVRVTIDGGSQDLGQGEWSDWYHLSFVMNPLLEAKAVTRVKVVEIGSGEKPFALLVHMLSIDPTEPVFWQPISQPASFAAELASWAEGPYETVGWPCLTNPMKDKDIDSQTFLEAIELTMGWRERVSFAALARDDWDVLFTVFTSPDRLQHMLYRQYDEGHPRHDPEEAASSHTFFGEEIALKDAIPMIYRQIDRIVGRVMDEHLREGDVLLLCADHGFSSFRREFDTNAWLHEKGYLHLPENAKKSSSAQYLSIVDWSRTQAYGLGLGMIFVNMQGREPNGIVPPEEADALLARIREDFLAAYDEVDGERIKVGRDAVLIKDVYDGPYLDRCGDMMLCFEEHYRVSWDSTAGKLKLVEDAEGNVVPRAVFEDNTNPWSGDHASVAPDIVEGIFFCNRKVAIPEGGVNVMHLAPTILALAGVPVPEEYDEEPLELAAD